MDVEVEKTFFDSSTLTSTSRSSASSTTTYDSNNSSDSSNSDANSSSFNSSESSSLESSSDSSGSSESESESDGHSYDSSSRPSSNGLLEPLYSGSSLSVMDSYLLLYTFFLRHSLSKKAFAELIRLVSAHLPATTSDKAARSLYQLRKYFMTEFCDLVASPYYYCQNCHYLFTDEVFTCPQECDINAPHRFWVTPISAQLKRMLEGEQALFKALYPLEHSHRPSYLACCPYAPSPSLVPGFSPIRRENLETRLCSPDFAKKCCM